MTQAIETQPPADGEVVSIIGSTLGLAGRYLISAGTNHFISDAKPSAGGPGEAVRAGELLLAALASCALALVQSQAAATGAPLAAARVEASFKRDAQDGTRYEFIRLRFALAGVDLGTARTLVAHFTDSCPIYNTLRRGGPIGVEVVTDTAA